MLWKDARNALVMAAAVGAHTVKPEGRSLGVGPCEVLTSRAGHVRQLSPSLYISSTTSKTVIVEPSLSHIDSYYVAHHGL